MWRERRFVAEDGHPQYLPVVCEHRIACWSDAQDRLPSMTCAGENSPPWVGPRYDERRVLVVLVNFFEYAGCDFGPDANVGIRFLGPAARAGFMQGNRRLSGGGGYRGTDVGSQAVYYPAAWFDALGQLSSATHARGGSDPLYSRRR